MIRWVNISIVPFSYDVEVVRLWMCCESALFLGGIPLGVMT
jgi:hypothetical protein